jgi:hypothetical protein
MRSAAPGLSASLALIALLMLAGASVFEAAIALGALALDRSPATG